MRRATPLLGRTAARLARSTRQSSVPAAVASSSPLVVEAPPMFTAEHSGVMPPAVLPPPEDTQPPLIRCSAADMLAEREATFAAADESAARRAEGRLFRVHAQCRAQAERGTAQPFAAFWNAFKTSAGDGAPPAWFEGLCRDLFFRTPPQTPAAAAPDPGAALEREIDVLARDADVLLERLPGDDAGGVEDSAAAASPSAAGGVDPYLWLPFDLRAEADYEVGCYEFPTSATATFGAEALLKLSVPGGRAREYVCFCDAYRFPDRRQLPTSVGTEPSRLLVCPDDEEPTVYLQLGPDIPPALWLPMKPTATAVRRTLSEFAAVAAYHRNAHHDLYERRLERARKMLAASQMGRDDGDAEALRFCGFEARDVHPNLAPWREFPNFQEFFLGEHDDPTLVLERLQCCPHLFAGPLLRQDTDVHSEGMAPSIDGPGVSCSAFRALYSKALVVAKAHLACEVKLPPQDLEGFEHIWRGADRRAVPASKIPVFVRVVWPDHRRMSGGTALIRRLNANFGTEFALDMPVDAALALLATALWAANGAGVSVDRLCGVRGMRRRMDELLEAAAAGGAARPALMYPGTHEIPNPQYTLEERIGMHIQYLAHMGDPESRRAIDALRVSDAAPIRMGCAKAALELGDMALFREIVSAEPPGRMSHYMTKLVVKRKARDLTSKAPMLFEEQYEFGAPLYTRSRRIDPASFQGALDIDRMKRLNRLK